MAMFRSPSSPNSIAIGGSGGGGQMDKESFLRDMAEKLVLQDVMVRDVGTCVFAARWHGVARCYGERCVNACDLVALLVLLVAICFSI
jgi:hypothetical protein